MATTSAFFQSFGKIPSCMLWLKRLVNGLEIWLLSSFSTRGGNWSGPLALLTSSCFNFFSTASCVIIMSVSENSPFSISGNVLLS